VALPCQHIRFPFPFSRFRFFWALSPNIGGRLRGADVVGVQKPINTVSTIARARLSD